MSVSNRLSARTARSSDSRHWPSASRPEQQITRIAEARSRQHLDLIPSSCFGLSSKLNESQSTGVRVSFAKHCSVPNDNRRAVTSSPSQSAAARAGERCFFDGFRGARGGVVPNALARPGGVRNPLSVELPLTGVMSGFECTTTDGSSLADNFRRFAYGGVVTV